MSAGYGPIRYPEERALEDAAFVQGVTPTRILAVLFHVLCVEVEATVTEGEPYALIDRFVTRGIAEARLTTVEQLAEHLALDPVIVSRAVGFLDAIGHVVEQDGRLAVTELGRRSLRDGRRYTVTVRDRRKLYFDAFGSRPLTRRYYDSRAVTLLDGVAARAAQAHRQGPRFHMVVSVTGFDPHALARLAADPERDGFNLPEPIDEPRLVAPPQAVFLPLYAVRAVGPDGRAGCLAYSQVGDTADEDLAPLVASSPVPGLLDVERSDGRTGPDERRAREWLGNRGLSAFTPEPTGHGTWQVTLPASSFDGDHRVPLTKVGSYVMLGSGFLRVWCASEEVRQRALLERINSYLAYRAEPEPSDVQGQVDPIARQLDLGTISLATLSHVAKAAGNRRLAAGLKHINAKMTR